MKKLALTTAVALGLVLAAVCAWGGWIYEGAWGKYGVSQGEFTLPEGVAVAPNGDVYVGDWWTNRIQYFTATGSYLGQWGSPGTGNGEFDTPTDIAVAANGRVYVGDGGNARVQYFTSSGSFLGKWGSSGTAAGQFHTPRGVAVAGNRTV